MSIIARLEKHLPKDLAAIVGEWNCPSRIYWFNVYDRAISQKFNNFILPWLGPVEAISKNVTPVPTDRIESFCSRQAWLKCGTTYSILGIRDADHPFNPITEGLLEPRRRGDEKRQRILGFLTSS